jgi:hypothetical protein
MATGTRLGAATVHHLTLARLDAGGTRLRLRALHVMATARPASAAPLVSVRKRSSGWSAVTPAPQPATARRDQRPVRRVVGQAHPRTHPR